MATGGQIAEFFATLGLRIDHKDVKKFDKTLKYLEARARKFSENSLSNVKLNISRFSFSKDFNTRLHRALRARMRVASSKGVSPEIQINRFDVDQYALMREMQHAIRYVENNVRMRVRTSVDRSGMTAIAAGTGGGTAISRTGGAAKGAGMGALAGSLGRGFIPGIGLGMGVSQLNKINQQLIGQKLSAKAVFGGEEAGKEQIQWMKDLGNDLGINYRSQTSSYVKMQAAAQTAGLSTEGGQHVFKSLAEYGRVMGLGDEDMKGTMRAVEQMFNKGQVYAEELKMQLGEKLPAAIPLMAEAVAGGDSEKLFKMMEEGELRAVDTLPKFANVLAQRARVGGALTDAVKNSLAEQQRFNNSFSDLVEEFGKAGFEKNQAGIFRTMAAMLPELIPLIQGMGEAWSYVSGLIRVPLGLLADFSTGLEKLSTNTGVAKGDLLALGTVVAGLAMPWTRLLTLLGLASYVIEDITAFMSGRKSLIGEVLGDMDEDSTETYIQFFEDIQSIFKSLSTVTGVIVDGWGEIFGLLESADIASPFLSGLTEVADKLENLVDMILYLQGKKSWAEVVGDEEGKAPSHWSQYTPGGLGGVLGSKLANSGAVGLPNSGGRSGISSRKALEERAATIIHGLGRMNRDSMRTDEMNERELREYRTERQHLERREEFFENNYNIEINSNSDPKEIVDEVMSRTQEEKDNATQKYGASPEG